jgi:3-oxoacyl-(acyl-carrier-protein) synthase
VIFVSSVGAVTAAGTGVESLVRALADPSWHPELGLERPDATPLPVATCREFTPHGRLSPLVARRLDRPARLLAVACQEALGHLGETLPWPRDRVGVTAGTGNAGTDALVEVLTAVFLASPEEAPPMQFPSTVANAAASQIGILEQLGGPNLTFAEKQVGGLRALAEAGRLVGSRRAAAVLACGVDEAQWLNAEAYLRVRFLRRNGGTGPILGEGAVALLLNPEPTPAPLALLAGWGFAAEPAPTHLYPVRGEALAAACRQALQRAGVAPREVDLVVSLHNGAGAADRVEGEAMAALLGSHRPAATAAADRLGEGAFCGAARAAIAVLALAGAVVPAWGPPSHLEALGYRRPAAAPRVALVPGVAAGGSAAALVLTAAG